MVQPRTSAQGAIQFQYLAEIAVGTTARIDLCRATSPPHLAGRLLAVKRLHEHIADDPSFANQFLDEVWVTALLKHPNVVEVAGWGNDDQGMYLAVELVQGVSMMRLMKTIFDTGEAFTERMVVFVAAQLCRGLGAAHSLRAQNGEMLHLVHRDLTPGNVLVGFNGDVKITDFGMAKAKQRITKTLTGLLKGQPQYMAPEQARGDTIDHRTDLFALGVMMFELFAGRKPWLATSDFDAVQAILSRPADDLQKVRPKIDKELASVVHRSLEKDPKARFQSANEIQARLDEWLLVHGYQEGNEEALGRFVRRNAMRQMRWFERAVAGELVEGKPEPPKVLSFTGAGPAVSIKGGESEETDVTDVEAIVATMHRRAADPATARKMVEERDYSEYSEEVPTIVQKSGSVPLPPRAGAPESGRFAAGSMMGAPLGLRSTPEAPPQAKVGPPPRPPAGRPGAPVPAAGSTKPPPAPAARAARVPGPPGARPFPLPNARPMHESIIDEESDARTTSVKARPRFDTARGRGIATLPREPAPSMSDAESEEVPTLPLQGSPHTLRRSRGAQANTSPLPGQIAPADPRVPPPPRSSPSLPSLQAIEDVGSSPRGPISEDKLFAEADRLALEAVRCGDEAKAAAARAERLAVIAKIAGDAAAIAVEAVRISSSTGIADAARRLDDAYALEMTVRRLSAVPLDLPAGAASSPAPSRTHQRAITTRMGPPAAPPSSPGSSSPRDRDPPSGYGPPSMSGVSGPPSTHVSSGTMPLVNGMRSDSSSMLPAPPRLPGGGTNYDAQAFEARLRPTIFGLPGVHVAALAIGTFVLVLILMWILMG